MDKNELFQCGGPHFLLRLMVALKSDAWCMSDYWRPILAKETAIFLDDDVQAAVY
jgi:hypothetical protein